MRVCYINSHLLFTKFRTIISDRYEQDVIIHDALSDDDFKLINDIMNDISSNIQKSLADTTDTCDLTHVLNGCVMKHNMPFLRDQTSLYLSVLNSKTDSNIVPIHDNNETNDGSLGESEEELNESTAEVTKASECSSTTLSTRSK